MLVKFAPPLNAVPPPLGPKGLEEERVGSFELVTTITTAPALKYHNCYYNYFIYYFVELVTPKDSLFTGLENSPLVEQL